MNHLPEMLVHVLAGVGAVVVLGVAMLAVVTPCVLLVERIQRRRERGQ